MARPRLPVSDYFLAGLTVLIVDRKRLGLKILKAMLEDFGAGRVLMAESAAQALDLVKPPARFPDLVICDWEGLGESGQRLLLQLRARELGLPFVLATRDTGPATVLLAKRLGVSALMRKPIAHAPLERKLKALVEAMPARAERRDASAERKLLGPPEMTV